MSTKSPESPTKRNLDCFNVLDDGFYDTPDKRNKRNNNIIIDDNSNNIGYNEDDVPVSPVTNDDINLVLQDIMTSPIPTNTIVHSNTLLNSTDWLRVNKDIYQEQENVPHIDEQSSIFQSAHYSPTPNYKYKVKKNPMNIQDKYQSDINNNIINNEFHDFESNHSSPRNSLIYQENTKAMQMKLGKDFTVDDTDSDIDGEFDKRNKSNRSSLSTELTTPYFKIPKTRRKFSNQSYDKSTINTSNDDLILRVEQMQKNKNRNMIIDSLSIKPEKSVSTKRSININSDIVNNSGNKFNISNTTAFDSDRKIRLDDASIAMAANALAEFGSPQGLRESLSETPVEIKSLNESKTIVRCNCKKSRCLKMYCDCFKISTYCNGCNCFDCANIKQFDTERKKAIDSIVERNPLAFKPRVTDSAVKNMKSHSSGCHCKRSNCLKKYCECFANNVACSDRCRCQECRNTNDLKKRSFSTSPNSSSQLLTSLAGKVTSDIKSTIQPDSKISRERTDSFISNWSNASDYNKALGVSSSGGTVNSNGSTLVHEMNHIYLNNRSISKTNSINDITVTSTSNKISISKLESEFNRDISKSKNINSITNQSISKYILNNNKSLHNSNNNKELDSNDNDESGFYLSRNNSAIDRTNRNINLNEISVIDTNSQSNSNSTINTNLSISTNNNDDSYRYISPSSSPLLSQSNSIPDDFTQLRSVSSVDREAGEILLALSPQQANNKISDKENENLYLDDNISVLWSQDLESSQK